MFVMGASGNASLRLRAWRDPRGDVLVKVTDWLFREPVTDQYFEREARLFTLRNYLWRYGPLTVLRKVRSRLAERDRNTKFAGAGFGVVVDAPSLPPGAKVLFLASNAPLKADELVVDAQLVTAAPADGLSAADLKALRDAVRDVKGYSRASGATLPPPVVQIMRSVGGDEVHRGEVPVSSTTDRSEVDRRREGRPTAVIFGLGNYAKTNILPNIRGRLELCCVHEIDPDQCAYMRGGGVTLDTCPHAREGEIYDAWFVAGYHHTHAELAAIALERGGYAVVEKPIATSEDQLARLRQVLKAQSDRPKLFACFQKRYAAFNRHIHADLGVVPGDAIHMSALVYEVPLPSLHWYRWPNSGSRIVSNACHWLDFFMWANEYSPFSHCSARRAGGDDVHCLVTLANGASLLLELTHRGSPRVGVRELIELRSRSATIRIVDAASYSAENEKGIIRRLRVNPTAAYTNMYRQVANTIATGGRGDSLDSLRSTELMLELESELQRIERPGC